MEKKEKEKSSNTGSDKKKTGSGKKNQTGKRRSVSSVSKKIKSSSTFEAESPENVYPDDSGAFERGDTPMSVVGHLNELRSRLIITLLTIIIVTLASFFISDHILKILTAPYIETGLKLNVFTLIEGFMLRLKSSLVMGILAGLPVIVYEIWKYISPAIELKDRRFIRFSIIGGVLLMYSGIAFTYFLILPVAIKMLLKLTPPEMNSLIGASQYLSFLIIFSLAMGILFELPIAIMILTRINIITPELLISKRKYAIVLIWVISAFLTPGPDVLSQAIMALPVMLLYEISIIVSKFVMKRKLKKNPL